MSEVESLLTKAGFERSPRGRWCRHDDGYGAPYWMEFRYKAPDSALWEALHDWLNGNGQASCEEVIREYGWQHKKATANAAEEKPGV